MNWATLISCLAITERCVRRPIRPSDTVGQIPYYSVCFTMSLILHYIASNSEMVVSTCTKRPVQTIFFIRIRREKVVKIHEYSNALIST